jgi:hypothetical protein
MAALRGTFTHELRGTVDLEAWPLNGQWICVARLGGKRFEQATHGEMWGVALQQVVQQALDAPAIDSLPRTKLEKRTPPPVTPPRRRAIRSVINPPPKT